MSTNYPSALDSYVTKVDHVDDVMADDHNGHSDAIVAVETELGTDPSGSFADVAARLARLESIGAHMRRVATANSDTASGTRTMVGYDETPTSDTGFTCDTGTGTITVPSDGYYLVTGHARFSANYTGGFATISVNDGSADLIRGSQFQSSTGGIADLAVNGLTPWITAGTVLRLSIYTGTSTSLVGNAHGSYYYFRVVRL
jgi:hypothetical protein